MEGNYVNYVRVKAVLFNRIRDMVRLSRMMSATEKGAEIFADYLTELLSDYGYKKIVAKVNVVTVYDYQVLFETDEGKRVILLGPSTSRSSLPIHCVTEAEDNEPCIG